MPGIGKDVLLPLFDIREEDEAFLCDIYDSHLAPQHELQQLLEESLVGKAQDWLHHVECAAALQRQRHDGPTDPLSPRDALEYVRIVWDQQQPGVANQEDHGALGWDETDRLMARARDLEARQEILLGELEASHNARELLPQKKRKKRSSTSGISSFWTDHDGTTSHISRQETTGLLLRQRGGCQYGLQTRQMLGVQQPQPAAVLTGKRTDEDQSMPDGKGLGAASGSWFSSPRRPLHTAVIQSAKAPGGVSPFFQATAHTQTKQSSPKRPPGGIVSSIPFPPLDASRFGIVQELEAGEPFWLLIVVTFLIKTNGRSAVPVFQKLRERFPGPEQLADPANAAEILEMIRHLGLGTQRLRFIQKYADAFLTDPPKPGIRHRVRHYARRESVPPSPPGGGGGGAEEYARRGDEDDAEAWEIGHMTKGRYALDSWRIFCRDAFLGKAEDYTGKGAARAEFQPEWMRVLPADKELRAFLRWMWMREGWEWDPVTGERRVLRREMETAVEEGRVGYDEEGGLRILEEPRDGFTREGLVVA